MNDDKPPMPPQPKTVEIEPPPRWAVDVTEQLAKKIDALHTDVAHVSENVMLLQHDAKDTKLRLRRLEGEVDDIKERQTRTSDGVRQTSVTDARHEAAIASIITEVAEVKTLLQDNNTATDRILALASGWASKHPAVVTAFVNLLMAAIAYATWRLQR